MEGFPSRRKENQSPVEEKQKQMEAKSKSFPSAIQDFSIA
jgi:hypothetical protein